MTIDHKSEPADFKARWQQTVLACRIGSATTAVALAVSAHALEDGTNACPGVRRLAHDLEMSEPTIRRALTKLRDVGLLVRTEFGSTAEKRSQPDRYDLAIPDDLENHVEVRPEPAAAPAGRGRGGVANHMRWHERRNIIDPSCIHCVEGWAAVLGGNEDMPTATEVEPAVTALYRYWDNQDRLLYVGITGDLHYRENSHIKGSSWMEFVARSVVERFPNRADARAAERTAIESEQPLFNVKHNDTPTARQRLVDYLVGHGRTDLLAPAVSRG